jgi:nitronate monooxygenase
VVAAGGIGNGQGIHKALSTGASAAALGTRFVATVESNAHPEYKRALLAAYAKDTALTICFQDGWAATHHSSLIAKSHLRHVGRGRMPVAR